MLDPDAIPSLLFARALRGAGSTAYFWRENGQWLSRDWSEAIGFVSRIARLLTDLGVRRGDRVAILSETRPEWAAVDFAVLCLGGVTVGIYPTLTPDQIAWQLQHAEVGVLVVENEAQEARVAGVRDAVPGLRHVVKLTPAPALPDSDPDWLRGLADAVRADDLATIIYTSGTTGNPKGAMLTHRNFVSVARASRAVTRLRPGDRAVVFLPLAHSLQRFTMYAGLLDDVEGVYAESIEKLPEALAFGRPTVLASVPRMLEKIRDRAAATARARGPRAARIYDWAFRVGRKRALSIESGEPLGLADRLQVAVADRLVFRRIRGVLGGRLRILVCGGAALDPEVARWYLALGVRVLEGWGLTETSAPATGNREERIRLGTVGLPLPGVEVRVATDGELLVRGPGVFKGYWKDPQATAAAIDADGWFFTGDIGTVDPDGFVRITDRKKEILVTAGGKNVPPVNIEKRIERGALVSQAVVLGDAKPYLAALITLDPEALVGLAKASGWPDEPVRARIARPEVQRAVALAVEQANAELAGFEQIKRWEILDEPLSVETGELTPTLKLKRRAILSRRAEAVARLYAARP